MLGPNELRDLLLTIDPKLTQHISDGSTGNYTVWSPLGFNTSMAGDLADVVMQYVQIDRYQTTPDDSVALAIIQALDDANVPQSDVITDHDPRNKVFRWIITCQVRRN